MPRHFTLTEAQALIPRIVPLLKAGVEARRRMESAEAGMMEMRRHVTQMGGVKPDRSRALELKMRRESAAEEIQRCVDAIHGLDVQVKDLDQGLIDFPTLYRGREVLLCYRLGESGISYWHESDAGFRGRQEIDQDFLDHHEGGGSHQ